jgi:NADH:ubiquinone oxidoreductase subunit 4 (subunit M)
VTEKTWLEIAVVFPLAGALLCALVAPSLAARVARVLCLVPLAIVGIFWLHTDPAVILAIPLTEGVWLPGVPVDFSLAVTGFSLPFLLLAQLTVTIALWQDTPKRSWASVPTLLFSQFALLVIFTSQDLILFVAAVQSFWLALSFGSQMEEEAVADKLMPFALTSGALLLTSAVILGALHLEQFQTFSTRLPALRELSFVTDGFIGDFTLAEVIFAMMAVATFLTAPVVPAHGWLQALLRGPNRSAQVLALGVAPALAVFTWLQWMVPVLPDAYATAAPWLVGLLALSLVYAGSLALAAGDLAEWLTAAVLVETALMLAGVAANQPESAMGSLLHCLVWPLAALGMAGVFAWMHTAFGSSRAEDIGALLPRAPRVAVLLGVFFLMAIAAPTTALFPSVLLILSGLLQGYPALGLVVCLGWALMVCAAVRIVRPFYFGTSLHEGIRAVPDIRWRRVAVAGVVVIFSAWVGMRPALLKSKTDPALKSYWKVPLKASLDAPGGKS